MNCVPCFAGTDSVAGASGCSFCTAGKSSEAGSSCTACEVGKTSGPGQAVCSECAANTYTPEEGSTFCTPCPAGLESGAGEGVCTNCTEGSASTPGRGCILCDAGKYAEEGASRCLECAANTKSVSGSSTCTACPDGSDSRVGSSTCTSCAAGKAASSFSSCKQCPPGKYAGQGAHDCAVCDANSYSANAGSSSCNTCQAGSESAPGARICMEIEYMGAVWRAVESQDCNQACAAISKTCSSAKMSQVLSNTTIMAVAHAAGVACTSAEAIDSPETSFAGLGPSFVRQSGLQSGDCSFYDVDGNWSARCDRAGSRFCACV